MNKFHLLSFFCFISALFFIVLGLLSGEIETGFILIFPFITSTGFYGSIGVILLFITFLLSVFGFITPYRKSLYSYDHGENAKEKKKPVKYGGVVLIGPIPVIFGSNWKIVFLLMIIAIIVMISLLFLRIF